MSEPTEISGSDNSWIRASCSFVIGNLPEPIAMRAISREFQASKQGAQRLTSHPRGRRLPTSCDSEKHVARSHELSCTHIFDGSGIDERLSPRAMCAPKERSTGL